ncbi:GMC oxidoreductase [Actinoplanes sp. Pm04-4]|uniref:GMC oxidoreductase n=1 Tax=Paractinoplanes pyxinae TaxID=2997416 RepID=A0ABT4BC38_9ACTN|nr:GMC oxidoreductase [Actinoplanes pyxinae]MCY1144071.1 GMC oxidoreductase [Actinoplanes pyxinae]
MATVTAVPESAECVIVGGGMAGLELAVQMARRGGRPPLVLEAGPDRGAEHYRWALHGAAADQYWIDPSQDESFYRPYEANDGSFVGLAGLRRRLGGRSLYWHAVTLPVEDWALDEQWPESVVRDLTKEWHGGEPLYARVERELAEWSGSNRATTRAGDRQVTLGGYLFQDVPSAIRHGEDGRWKAYSPLEHLTAEDATILCDSEVLGVLTQKGVTSGVRIRRRGVVHDIRAEKVVLAAGTIESSRLAIQALSNEGLLDRPQLTGLVDKVANGFSASLAPGSLPAEIEEAAAANVKFQAPARDGLRSNIFLMTSVNEHGLIVLRTSFIGEQIAGPLGVVECDDRGVWPWHTSVRCSMSPVDRQLARAQQAEIQRFWGEICHQAGMIEAPALEFDTETGSPDVQQRLVASRSFLAPGAVCTYSFPLGTENHEAGTLPLGSILDDDHQFRGLAGLYAVGPAVFPRAGAANPALTILALARRLAGILAPRTA